MRKIVTKRRIFCAAVVLAIIIVPFLYSYFYLGAFWDPYSKLETLPVAVVNKDAGATINGEDRNLGQEMCDRLEEDGSLKFIFTDTETAKFGTEGTDYYATITIPQTFSENIASANSNDKQSATIIYSPNEKRNFLASQILARAVLEVEEETRSNVNKEIVQQLSDKLKEVPNQLTELQDGLSQLGDGTSKLLEGTGTLFDGTGTLLNGTKALADGSGTLQNGTKTLADGTGTLLDGTKALADGAATLLDGTETLADGTQIYYDKFAEYAEGVATVKDGSSKLAGGAQTLEAGIGQLKSGADQLVDKTSNIEQITTGAQTLAEGTKAFDLSLTQYTAGVNSLISNVNNTATFLTQYVKANPSLMKDPTFAAFMTKLSDPANTQNTQTLLAASTQINAASVQLTQGAAQLSEGTKSLPALNIALQTISAGAATIETGSVALTEGAKTLDAGVTSLSTATDQLYSAAGDIADGAESLNNGANELNTGVNNLNSGAEDLNSGAKDLKNGAEDLNTGVKELNSGAEDLNSGANDLYKGTEDLNDGVATAQSSVTTAIQDANNQLSSLDGLADYAAAPVSVEQSNITSIANYGTAFAPYFMSLSLWVGALILFVGIYLDTEGKFMILSRESNHRMARSFLFLLIGFAQAIALAVVVRHGLGLKVENVFLYYASICLVSMVFIAMVQFFMVHLKSAGKLISIVMLILQLTSCGGTFPMELVPKIFNKLFPFMPMTYSVALFKEAITSTNKKNVLYNGGILCAILVVFMSLTITLSAVKAKKAAKTTVQLVASSV
ncbi:MAG: YhgE/Pip domain-containing protein [Herbinix sp.]|nr:YhgE/Pip domain-containing protein [Herbinix sp.]